MKFISVIPARSGSKGVKNKNIFPLNKKPLISYTFNAVKKSMIKNNFILTDNKKIKRIAKNFGINNDYERPKKLSQSNTSLIDTLFHFYKWTRKKSIYFELRRLGTENFIKIRIMCIFFAHIFDFD